MVAIINFTSSLSNALNYNEQKLKQEVPRKRPDEERKMKAEFIHASGFVKDTDKLGYTEKFRRLQKQMKLRESRKESVVHISLNFDPSEKDKLDKEALKKLADTYMEKIGFGGQPYLVYQHNDAGHPHIHIVSCIIRNDGSPINTHKIGVKISEPVCRQMEKDFGLMQADKIQKKEVFQLPALNAQKLEYGKSETKRAITNVLDVVLKTYKYTSLSELNAILKQYNVVADDGTKHSRLQKNKGIIYRVLDENGNKKGAPIKASAIYNNPGLKFLEPLFNENDALRQPFKARIRNAIDVVLKKGSVKDLEGFQRALKKERIQLVVHTNAEGRDYGITFIDHHNKCVFKGSDLDKNYSLAKIEAWLKNADQLRPREQQKPIQKHIPATVQKQPPVTDTQQPASTRPPAKTNPPASISLSKHAKKCYQKTATEENKVALPGQPDVLKELLKQEYTQPVAAGFKKKKKRKKRRLHL